jgi:hypothetical protein
MAKRLVSFLFTALLLTSCSALNPTTSERTSDEVFANAYREHQSGIQITGTGAVIRILSDDNEGGRHQRFIVELASGQTLLVAHNIDVAPRVSSLSKGDAVEFSGVYEWNDEGGVVHWTHHDPRGKHEAGWIRHNGHLYK